jgi:pimeloyl-ACP methyl ester carboxylesterase
MVWQAVLAFLGIILISILLALSVPEVTVVQQPALGGTYIEGILGYSEAINPILAPLEVQANAIDQDLSALVFNGLTSRSSLRYFLAERCYHDPGHVTDEMVNDYWHMAHQPGGLWAPAAFLSQRLNRDVSQAWQSLTQPVLIVWGGQAQFAPVERVQQFLHLRPTTQVEILDRCGILPHDEQAERFNTLVRDFLGR